MLKIAFVDPFISLQEIASGLRKNQIQSLAIFQRNLVEKAELQQAYSPQLELFDEVVYIEPNETLDEIVTKLQSYQIDFIFNGFDNSTPLADAITAKLTPDHANDPSSSNHRYHKIASQKRLQAAGIQIPNCLEVADKKLSSAEEKILQQWNFPLILKPATAGGTTGFSECHNISEINQQLQGKLSEYLGYRVNSYLIQEKLMGDEFAIDTFSSRGKHQIVHIRRYHKESFAGFPIPRFCETILPTDELWSRLSEYIISILDAVGFHHGFCHSEVFLTKKNLFLIDINPRLPGARNSSCMLAKETYGYSHVDILSAVLHNKSLQQRYQYGRIVYLQNLQPRNIGKVNLELLQKLPSFKYCVDNKKEGSMMSLPTKLGDTVAFVVLAHVDKQQLEKDCAKIFTLEKSLELF